MGVRKTVAENFHVSRKTTILGTEKGMILAFYFILLLFILIVFTNPFYSSSTSFFPLFFFFTLFFPSLFLDPDLYSVLFIYLFFFLSCLLPFVTSNTLIVHRFYISMQTFVVHSILHLNLFLSLSRVVKILCFFAGWVFIVIFFPLYRLLRYFPRLSFLTFLNCNWSEEEEEEEFQYRFFILWCWSLQILFLNSSYHKFFVFFADNFS